MRARNFGNLICIFFSLSFYLLFYSFHLISFHLFILFLQREMFSVVLKDLVDEEHQVTDRYWREGVELKTNKIITSFSIRWFLFPDKRIFESRNQIFSTMTASFFFFIYFT